MFQKARLWILEQALRPAIVWLDGKKTATGALSLLLWVVIYGLPAARPDLGYVAVFGQQAKDFLEGAGVHLDQELLASGLGLTLVGLLHKLKKYYAPAAIPAPNVIDIKRK